MGVFLLSTATSFQPQTAALMPSTLPMRPANPASVVTLCGIFRIVLLLRRHIGLPSLSTPRQLDHKTAPPPTPSALPMVPAPAHVLTMPFGVIFDRVVASKRHE